MKPFRFKQFEVMQHPKVFKVGTDACILGALARIGEATSILDVGTGSGVVALMCAQRNSKAKILGVDSNHFSVELATKNFSDSIFSDRLSCRNLDLLADVLPHLKFDHIICNPPFFANGIQSINNHKAQARHESENGLSRFLAKFQSLLTNTGKITMILPQNRMQECAEMAQIRQLFASALIHIRPFSHRPPNRIVIELAKSNQKSVERDFTLYQSEQLLSKQATYLLEPFYLHL